MKKIIIILITTMIVVACGGKEPPVHTEKVNGSLLKSQFKVWGNCETCKETIEGSLKSEGITASDWNVESKIITVTYDTAKTNLDAIEKNIASVGYDNVKYKGDNRAYDKLPPCCKYDRK